MLKTWRARRHGPQLPPPVPAEEEFAGVVLVCCEKGKGLVWGGAGGVCVGVRLISGVVVVAACTQ